MVDVFALGDSGNALEGMRHVRHFLEHIGFLLRWNLGTGIAIPSCCADEGASDYPREQWIK